MTQTVPLLELMKYDDSGIMGFIESVEWVMTEDAGASSSGCHQCTGRLSVPGVIRLSLLRMADGPAVAVRSRQ